MGIGHGPRRAAGCAHCRHPARQATRMAQGGAQREVDAVPTGADVAGAAPRPRRRIPRGPGRVGVAAGFRAARGSGQSLRRTSSRSRTTTSARRRWCSWGRGRSARRCSRRRASSRARGAWTLLAATRPGLVTVWTHSLLGLVWLLNWSTLGASMRARRVIDDEGYRRSFLLRPSAAWIALFCAGRGGVSTVRVHLGARNRGARGCDCERRIDRKTRKGRGREVLSGTSETRGAFPFRKESRRYSSTTLSPSRQANERPKTFRAPAL